VVALSLFYVLEKYGEVLRNHRSFISGLNYCVGNACFYLDVKICCMHSSSMFAVYFAEQPFPWKTLGVDELNYYVKVKS
jgi:hypothetical protein